MLEMPRCPSSWKVNLQRCRLLAGFLKPRRVLRKGQSVGSGKGKSEGGESLDTLVVLRKGKSRAPAPTSTLPHIMKYLAGDALASAVIGTSLRTTLDRLHLIDSLGLMFLSRH